MNNYKLVLVLLGFYMVGLVYLFYFIFYIAFTRPNVVIFIHRLRLIEIIFLSLLYHLSRCLLFFTLQASLFLSVSLFSTIVNRKFKLIKWGLIGLKRLSVYLSFCQSLHIVKSIAGTEWKLILLCPASLDIRASLVNYL